MHTVSINTSCLPIYNHSPNVLYLQVKHHHSIINQFQIVLLDIYSQLLDSSIIQFRHNKPSVFIQYINTLNSNYVANIQQLVYIQALQVKQLHKVEMDLYDKVTLLDYVKQVKTKSKSYKKKVQNLIKKCQDQTLAMSNQNDKIL